jgi:hypothetical protein
MTIQVFNPILIDIIEGRQAQPYVSNVNDSRVDRPDSATRAQRSLFHLNRHPERKATNGCLQSKDIALFSDLRTTSMERFDYVRLPERQERSGISARRCRSGVQRPPLSAPGVGTEKNLVS